MNEFFHDVWRGLTATPKYLESKYFYDETGDGIFQEIMHCPEYYLTNCEMDIFTHQCDDLYAAISRHLKEFDVVELGAGDATKSIHLLECLVKNNVDFTYYPIDISGNIISQLSKTLPAAVPGLKVHGLNGDYFDMLEEVKEISSRNKIVLFLGSSIGNIPVDETAGFLSALKSRLLPGDLLLTGYDLKKDPAVILAAYNDKQGVTRRFNLNLLQRINDTLDADFDLGNFEHKPTYDPQTGACKSFLVSTKDQRIRIGEVGWIYFKAGEPIYMEVSQKYTAEQTDHFAKNSGFTPIQHFYDQKNWFLDALWQCD
jgi:dimethylhistidine N-methyltransferase